MKQLLIILAFVSMSINAQATHGYGGEITWKCFTSGPNAGKFKFYMKLYRDCGSGNATLPGGTVVLNSNSPAGSITLNQVGSNTDVSPTCYLNPPPIRCNVAASGQGALEEARYESAFINLNGTPPAGGWIFSYSLCCRPNTITNLVNAGSNDLYLRAVMYPFIVGVAQNTNVCYDSSPRFLESPMSVVCIGSQKTYSHYTYDDDLDSVYYEWAPSLGSNGNPISYSSPYSFNNPLPNGTNQTQLDNTTGNITFNPNVGGSFATNVKVSVYRVGQKIAEIFRDIPVAIRNNCANLPNGLPNLPPSVSISEITGFPEVSPVVINNDTAYYEISVTAGELVKFNIYSQDSQYHTSNNAQIITFQPKGGQFGNPISSATLGCLTPPCATISPISPQSSLNNPLTNQVTFEWQTTCNHLSIDQVNGQNSTSYPFALIMMDNYCPVPSFSLKTVIITLNENAPKAPLTTNSCARVNSNGNIIINWGFPPDTGTGFNKYLVYHSFNPTTNFTVLDSINDYNQLSYIHLNPSGAQNYYFLKTLGECGLTSTTSDTIESYYLTHPQNFNAYDSTGWANFKCKSSELTANFQWQQNSGTGWINLNNFGGYSGTTSDSLVIIGVTTAMNNYGYRCIVTGCSTDTTDVATLTVTNGIGLGETTLEKLTISPNPTTGLISLSSKLSGTYELLSLDGRLVESGEIKKEYDLSQQPIGIYNLRLLTADGTRIFKIVKH